MWGSSIRGAGRSTLDVDVSAEFDEIRVRDFARHLASSFYVSEAAAVDAVRRQSCFNLIHNATSLKVDLFVSRRRPFDRSVMARATANAVDSAGELNARVATAEDIILLKLEWYRLGDETSERQWNDVLQVARLQAERLDVAYLRNWGPELKVADLVERLLAAR